MHLPASTARPRPNPTNVELPWRARTWLPRRRSARLGYALVPGLLFLVLVVPTLAFAPAMPSSSAPVHLSASAPALAPSDNGTCGGSGGGSSAPADGGGEGPCGTWAWGAAANLTAGFEYEGAYNATQFLTGGGLTAQGAFIDLQASLSAQWAAYTIVNVTSPTHDQLYVTFQAGQMVQLDVSVAAQGTFPAAGTYGPDTNVTLVPMNVSLVAHIKLVDRYQAFLNLTTDPNGSLALQDEHLQFFRTVDLYVNEVNFPNITTDPSGNAQVVYNSASLTAHAQIDADVLGTFSPALQIVEAPLSLGKSWNADSSARLSGQELWTLTASGVAPNGTPFSISQNGQNSVSANVQLALTFTVVGERTIYFPNGSSETDYVISCDGGDGQQGAYLYNGLLVVPSSVASNTGGASSQIAAHPAAQDLSSSTSTPNRPLYSPQKRMTDSSDATPVSGQTVTASPMSPAKAQSLLDHLGGLSPLHFGPTAFPIVDVALAGGGLVVFGFAFRTIRRARRDRVW